MPCIRMLIHPLDMYATMPPIIKIARNLPFSSRGIVKWLLLNT